MAKPRQILTDREKSLMLALYEMGKTDQQVADVLGMPRKTLTGVIRYNNLTASIKRGIADDKVEMSLYGKAIGGNVTAQIFWLCNRQPKRWVNVQKIEHSGRDGESINIKYVPAKSNE